MLSLPRLRVIGVHLTYQAGSKVGAEIYHVVDLSRSVAHEGEEEEEGM